MPTLRYVLAIGGATSLRDIDVALACGQSDLLVSVGTPLARHLRQTQRHYHTVMGRMVERSPDLPLVPVLGYGTRPGALAVDALQGWAGARADLVDGAGIVNRPAYALGGLVPERGSARSITWIKQVAAVLEGLIADEGVDPDLLGIHLLGTTRPEYIAPLAAVGVPICCDTSTPMRQAGAGDAALAWGYTEAFGLSRDLLRRSRCARVAFWICRERSKLGLPWTAPDAAWLEALPALTPIVRPEQLTLLAA